MPGLKNSYYLLRLILSNLILINLVSLAGCSGKNLDLSKKYYKEGISYFNNKEYVQALEAFKKSSELIPYNDPSACNMIGLTYNEMKDYDNALLWFKKAMDSSDSPSTSYVIYIHIGDVYNKKGDRENAIVWYGKSKSINPKADISYMKLCDIFLKQGEIEKAIEECKTAIKKSAPYNSEPHLKLGDIYEDKGLYDEAMIEWNAAKKDPYYKKIYKEYDPIKERLENIQSKIIQNNQN